MKVFALSDIHADYPQNRLWLQSLPSREHRRDLLILAGDISHDLVLLRQVLAELREKFREVLFVPGNHELWVRGPGCGEFECSLEKFHAIEQMCAELQIRRDVRHYDGLSIVPLLAWYDFSFGAPSADLKLAWRDFRACRWPSHLEDAATLARFFLDKNLPALETRNEVVISFSHFLPRIDVMPSRIPPARRMVYPVLGSTALGEQVRRLDPDIHVYGHSHVNQAVTRERVHYVNNAFAYPSEARIARKRLHCVLDLEDRDRAGAA